MPTIDPTPRKRPPRPDYKAKRANERATVFVSIFAGWCLLAVGVGLYFGGHHILIMALMPVLMIVMLLLAQIRSKPSQGSRSSLPGPGLELHRRRVRDLPLSSNAGEGVR